jgi:hypothetical protein
MTEFQGYLRLVTRSEKSILDTVQNSTAFLPVNLAGHQEVIKRCGKPNQNLFPSTQRRRIGLVHFTPTPFLKNK